MIYVGKSDTGGQVFRKAIIDDAISALRRIADTMPHGTRETDRKLANALIEEGDKWRAKLQGDKPALDRIGAFIRAHM